MADTKWLDPNKLLVPQVVKLARSLNKPSFSIMEMVHIADPEPINPQHPTTWYLLEWVLQSCPDVFEKTGARWGFTGEAPVKPVKAEKVKKAKAQAKKQAKTVKEETAKEMEARFTEEIKAGLATLRGAAALVGGEKSVAPEMPRPTAVKKNGKNKHPDLAAGHGPTVRRAGR